MLALGVCMDAFETIRVLDDKREQSDQCPAHMDVARRRILALIVISSKIMCVRWGVVRSRPVDGRPRPYRLAASSETYNFVGLGKSCSSKGAIVGSARRLTIVHQRLFRCDLREVSVYSEPGCA